MNEEKHVWPNDVASGAGCDCQGCAFDKMLTKKVMGARKLAGTVPPLVEASRTALKSPTSKNVAALTIALQNYDAAKAEADA